MYFDNNQCVKQCVSTWQGGHEKQRIMWAMKYNKLGALRLLMEYGPYLIITHVSWWYLFMYDIFMFGFKSDIFKFGFMQYDIAGIG